MVEEPASGVEGGILAQLSISVFELNASGRTCVRIKGESDDVDEVGRFLRGPRFMIDCSSSRSGGLALLLRRSGLRCWLR